MSRNLSSPAFLIICCTWILLTLHSCTQISYTYGATGNAAISSDGKYVVILVAESRALSKQVNGGYRSTAYKTAYWLKLYETATGKLINKKKIISAAEENNMLPVCYGGYGDKIWLHTTGLKAYAITSLEEVVDEESLGNQNSFNINNFPEDARFIYEMVYDGYIRFIGRNETKYRLDLNTLKIESEKERPQTFAEKTNEQLHTQSSLNPTYGVRCDTFNNKLWILAKDSVTAIDTNPGNAENGPFFTRLKLFTANYTTTGISSHRFYTNSNLKQLPDPTYINGVFLKDFNTKRTVRLQEPGVYIILHNDSLSSNSKVLLTAVGEGNNVLWETNTGLNSSVGNCIVKGNYCVLAGNKEYLIGPHIGNDMVCVINTTTGKMQKLSLKE